jgi:hypothetical protein
MLGLLASAPALPLGEAGKYVAGAYIVFLLLVVIYVAIMAAKLQRIERELRELGDFAEQGKEGPHMARPKAAAMGGIDSAQPSPGPDRNLIPSGPGEGPGNRPESHV